MYFDHRMWPHITLQMCNIYWFLVSLKCSLVTTSLNVLVHVLIRAHIQLKPPLKHISCTQGCHSWKLYLDRPFLYFTRCLLWAEQDHNNENQHAHHGRNGHLENKSIVKWTTWGHVYALFLKTILVIWLK